MYYYYYECIVMLQEVKYYSLLIFLLLFMPWQGEVWSSSGRSTERWQHSYAISCKCLLEIIIVEIDFG